MKVKTEKLDELLEYVNAGYAVPPDKELVESAINEFKLLNNKKTKIEKDIETTIKVIRHMTGGQGYASISIFDAGAGGGFNDGDVVVNLERDGLTLNKKVYTPQDLKDLILASLKSYDGWGIEDINSHYKEKKRKWNK